MRTIWKCTLALSCFMIPDRAGAQAEERVHSVAGLRVGAAWVVIEGTEEGHVIIGSVDAGHATSGRWHVLYLRPWLDSTIFMLDARPVPPSDGYVRIQFPEGGANIYRAVRRRSSTYSVVFTEIGHEYGYSRNAVTATEKQVRQLVTALDKAELLVRQVTTPGLIKAFHTQLHWRDSIP